MKSIVDYYYLLLFIRFPQSKCRHCVVRLLDNNPLSLLPGVVEQLFLSKSLLPCFFAVCFLLLFLLLVLLLALRALMMMIRQSSTVVVLYEINLLVDRLCLPNQVIFEINSSRKIRTRLDSFCLECIRWTPKDDVINST